MTDKSDEAHLSHRTDWTAWHEDYDDPGSLLSQRLCVVQQHIDEWLDATAPGPVAVLSSCAGEARDLLGLLERRTDAERVTATLIEADPGLAERAAHRAALLPSRTEVRCTDAGATDAYAGAAPADLVLLCGIFGNVADDDVHRTVAAARQLCAAGARVIWTRHRREPDLTPRIRGWFDEHEFEEVHFVAPEPPSYSVGVQRFVGRPSPLVPGRRLFTFVR